MHSRRGSSLRPQWARALAFLALVLAPHLSSAQTRGVPVDEIVFLVSPTFGGCASAGHTLNVDCFESVAAVQSFLWGSGTGPGASDPLIVDIGPGSFSGSLDCPAGGGYVTFRGVGRERTTLVSGGAFTVQSNGCERLEFQDLTLLANGSAPDVSTVIWSGCGSGTFTDTDVIVRDATTGSAAANFTAAFWDKASQVCTLVYWFGSRIFNEGDGALSFGIYSQGAQHWLYGSDVKVTGSVDMPSPAGLVGVYVNFGDVRLYGSTVRALVGSATTIDFNSHPLGAVVGYDFNAILTVGGIVHMHGGIIVADASASTLAIDADGAEGTAHLLDTAFNVVPGPGGNATRLKADPLLGTKPISPFQWPPAAAPPAITSLDGSDQFIETDCSALGDCDAGGNQTHLMIYNPAACPTESWLDSTTGRCRNDTTP